MEEVLGEKPCVKPVSIASNLNKRQRVTFNFKELSDSNQVNEETSSSSTQNEEIPPKKRKMPRIQRELQDWSAALLADAKTREEARKRRHQEAIAESKAAIDVYKEMMEKLIGKLWIKTFFIHVLNKIVIYVILLLYPVRNDHRIDIKLTSKIDIIYIDYVDLMGHFSLGMLQGIYCH